MSFTFLEIIGILLIIGIIVFYLFKLQVKSQNSKQRIDLFADKKKDSLPIRLQAHERMLLFCERINPIKMLVRIKPISENTNDYLLLILQNIEQEFEHNLVQQIYLSDECWSVIIASKTAVIKKLKTVATASKSAQELRENMMLTYKDNVPPTDTAIAFIKADVKKML